MENIGNRPPIPAGQAEIQLAEKVTSPELPPIGPDDNRQRRIILSAQQALAALSTTQDSPLQDQVNAQKTAIQKLRETSLDRLPPIPLTEREAYLRSINANPERINIINHLILQYTKGGYETAIREHTETPFKEAVTKLLLANPDVNDYFHALIGRAKPINIREEDLRRAYTEQSVQDFFDRSPLLPTSIDFYSAAKQSTPDLVEIRPDLMRKLGHYLYSSLQTDGSLAFFQGNYYDQMQLLQDEARNLTGLSMERQKEIQKLDEEVFQVGFGCLHGKFPYPRGPFPEADANRSSTVGGFGQGEGIDDKQWVHERVQSGETGITEYGLDKSPASVDEYWAKTNVPPEIVARLRYGDHVAADPQQEYFRYTYYFRVPLEYDNGNRNPFCTYTILAPKTTAQKIDVELAKPDGRFVPDTLVKARYRGKLYTKPANETKPTPGPRQFYKLQAPRIVMRNLTTNLPTDRIETLM